MLTNGETWKTAKALSWIMERVHSGNFKHADADPQTLHTARPTCGKGRYADMFGPTVGDRVVQAIHV